MFVLTVFLGDDDDDDDDVGDTLTGIIDAVVLLLLLFFGIRSIVFASLVSRNLFVSGISCSFCITIRHIPKIRRTTTDEFRACRRSNRRTGVLASILPVSLS